MKKRMREVLIIILLGCIGLLWGWTAYVQDREEPIDVIYIPKIIDDTNEFWSSLLAGAKMAAQEYNVNLRIVAAESELDYEGQNEWILWAVEQKPDAIMISACDYNGTLTAARKVKESGIPLIFVDSNVEEPLEDCMVSTDNFIAGTRLGELAKQMISDGTKIAVVSHVKKSSTAKERMDGIAYALDESAGQIVQVVYGDSDYAQAQRVTSELLNDYPDIGLIIATNEYSAVGAVRAVKNAGRQNEIAMIGFDNSIEQVQFLEEGILDGIVVQKSFNMGYLGVQQAAAIVRGEPYQRYIDSGSATITVENMQEPESQKLLFPFIQEEYQY